MASLDADLDRLYQRPLAEFTAARNALAARAGDQRAAIKALQKPSTAAWAVNQLYWQQRPLFTRLVAAADKLRQAHTRVLSGKKADVPGAESAHNEALKAALAGVQAILQQAGDRASAAVINDIRETLLALPSDERPGRLVRPLKPMGFGALLRMLPGSAAAAEGRAGPVEAPRPRAVPEPITRGKDDAASRRARDAAERAARAEMKRAEAERKRQRAAIERELRDHRAAERAEAGSLAEAREKLARAEREEQRRQAALEEQRFEVRRLAAEAASQDQKVKAAAEARAALERSLADLE